MRPIPIEEIMSVEVVSAPPQETVDKAAKLMAAKEVGSVLVVAGGKPVGILTERDLVRKVLSPGLNPEKIKLEEIMSNPVRTVDVKTDVNEAAEIMERNNIHKLPVVENGEVKGIVTDHDILKIEPYLVEALKEREEIRKNEIIVPDRKGVRGVCELCENYSSELEELNGCWMCPVCKGEMR